MLQLKGIKKDYSAGDTVVHALKGVSLDFRESEFVSILGQSGCGKTTMLNIIGGLDQYSEGDLVINGQSTKTYKDRNWDTYRNHTIGFVFQSYNLIPHQTVLQNVELALTLSGVSKAERRERAKKALEQVGLGTQLKKKPSEMSGGQMQRVAIARALVNNPDIILADEPTGALDTETSIQVMEILKEVAKTKLVIMVTHNPELAEEYSTRIIRMLDGEVRSDSNPLSEEELSALHSADEEKLKAESKKKKPSMSFFTAFGLSLKNLFTKKSRTVLTSFAGSIGIIGIALIYAVSQGLTTYINQVQEETLASAPIIIEATTVDMSTLMQTFMGDEAESDGTHENDAVYSKSSMYNMISSFSSIETTKNDLKSFKKFIEEEQNDPESGLAKALNGVKYSYDLDMLVYAENVDGNIIKSDAQDVMMNIFSKYLGMDMSGMMSFSENSGMASMFGGSSSGGRKVWTEMLEGENGEVINPILENQYDVIYGKWPTEYNEIVLVLDENNEVDDMALYCLGLQSEDEVTKVLDAIKDGSELEKREQMKFSYEDICNMEFRVILNSSCYEYDEETGIYKDLRNDQESLRKLYDEGINVKIAGIIKPSETAGTTMLSGNVAYTSLLTKYVIEQAEGCDAVKAQMASPDKDIFTNLYFKPENKSDLTDADKEKMFREYIETLDTAERADLFAKLDAMINPPEETDEEAQAVPTEEELLAMILPQMAAQTGMTEDQLQAYLASMSEEEKQQSFAKMMEADPAMAEMFGGLFGGEEAESEMSIEEMSEALDTLLADFTTAEYVEYFDTVVKFAPTDYDANLISLGCLYLDDPARINLYASTFESKDTIEEVISKYNDTVEELSKITYTDYVGIMMSSITTIINAITYVLIGFVAISLIVSSIMIGVITLISVQERTKEIGILRAIGASKRDVSSMFNAETVIIGFTSGLIGVIITYLLCIPLNHIIHDLTEIEALNAYLPPITAVILVLISVLLTLIAGVIPSGSAAKKDPVVALRTE